MLVVGCPIIRNFSYAAAADFESVRTVSGDLRSAMNGEKYFRAAPMPANSATQLGVAVLFSMSVRFLEKIPSTSFSSPFFANSTAPVAILEVSTTR